MTPEQVHEDDFLSKSLQTVLLWSTVGTDEELYGRRFSGGYGAH